ncbi:MAG: VOC family protein [Oceanococcus sp.]
MNAAPHRHVGDIRQLGYLVEDLDEAVAAWQNTLGVGPWMFMRNIELDCVYHGEHSTPLIDIALSYRGEMQIELIQQRNDAASPYLESVRKKQFGLHHTAFLCDNIDDDIAALTAQGLELVCDIRMPGPGAGRYAYFASAVPGDSSYIELLEATLMMKTLFADGISEAQSWQGEARNVELNLGPMLSIMRGFKRLMRLLSGKRS